MKILNALWSYLSSTSLLADAPGANCKCTPNRDCWPSELEWASLNITLSGALIRGVPPGSVCYPEQPNYNEDACASTRARWFDSTWHAANPVSIDYPIWTNNSCNPIYPNGTSLTGDVNAGKRGCSIGNYPVYVVNATTTDQVAEAFRWAGEKNIRVTIKATGHSCPGRSIGYGNLSIWTRNFRGIEYLPSFEPKSCVTNASYTAVRVSAGHTGGEVQSEMEKHNAIIVTGANPSVGLVGWFTGGGHGTLSSTYGMGADNVLEATIVTPDGSVHTANPCLNPDIFFTIRGGGGGTYGVVVEAVVRTFPNPQTTLHTFAVKSLSPNTSSEFWELMGFLHAEMARLKDGGMQGYYYIVGPPTTPTLSFQWTFLLYDKPPETAAHLLAPITAHLDQTPHLFASHSTTTHSPSYHTLYNAHFQNEPVATSSSAYGSRLLSPRSLSNPNTTAHLLARIGPSTNPSTPNAPFANPILIGHMIAPTTPPSYSPSTLSLHPAWRNTLVHFVVAEGFPDGLARPLVDAVYRDVSSEKVGALRALAPETGAYFNEPDCFEPGWGEAFFGRNYARLRAVKGRVDPGGLLWCRGCVGSEGVGEVEDGVLCKTGREGGGGDWTIGGVDAVYWGWGVLGVVDGIRGVVGVMKLFWG